MFLGEKTMKTQVRRFFADRRGAVAIMTALAMIPVLLAIGGAIDYARIMALRTRFQQATDSAALAALASLSNDMNRMANITMEQSVWGDLFDVPKLTGAVDYQAVARNYIEQNFNSSKSFNVTTTAAHNWTDGTMTVISKTSASTFLLGLAGINNIDLTSSATAAVGEGGQPQEIAIAFDTTYSMNFKGRKQAAIAAAKDFIGNVMNYPSGVPNPFVSVALVPFNDYVNVGSKSFWEKLNIGVSWLTSTDDIVQTFPEVCQEARTENKTTEKTICTPYEGSCTSNNCTDVPATCFKDGESYPCTTRKCEQVSYACTQQECKGTGQFETTTTTTPRSCTPAYEIRTPWTGCVGSRDTISDEIDLADDKNKVSAVFSVACPNMPINYLLRNRNYPGALSEVPGQFKYYISRKPEAELKQALDNLTFDGSTYIAPGLLWAWRVLSPEKPVAGWYDANENRSSKSLFSLSLKGQPIEAIYPFNICGQEVNSSSFANNWNTTGLNQVFGMATSLIPGCPYKYAKKSIILMTDGYSTKSASYDDMGRHEKTDRAAANEKLARICKNIKAKGIKIYTIAFMVNDNDTLTTLTSCASDASSYFDAANPTQLSSAFQAIGNNFTKLRLIK